MRRIAPCCLLLLAPCCTTAEEPGKDLEFLEAPITSFHDLGNRVSAVGLGEHSRSFTIHPAFSPEADTLVAFAKKAQEDGRTVHATVWIRDPSPKKEAFGGMVEWAFVIVRLADTRDPRAPAAPR